MSYSSNKSDLVILAGGLGTRLRSMHLGVSKPLVPIRQRSFLEHQLRMLKRYGFRNVTLAISTAALDIRRALGTGEKLGMRLTYSVDPRPIGTGSAIVRALPLLTDPFYIVNGDTYFSFNPRIVERVFSARSPEVVIATIRRKNKGRYTTITSDRTGLVTSLSNPAKGSYTNSSSGVVLARKSACKGFRATEPSSLEKDIFATVVRRKALYVVHAPGTFWDIGTPQSYRYLNSNFKP